MKKEIIYFDEKSYNRAINNAEKLVNDINNHIPDLLEFEDKVDLKMIRDILTKERYNEKMKQYCKQFSVRYEDLKFTEHEFIFKLANTAIQYLFKFKKDINISHSDVYMLYEDILQFEDNKVYLADKWKKIIKDRNTYFTETDKENELLKDMVIVRDILNSISDKIGSIYYSPKDIIHYLMYDKTYILDVHKFRAIANQIRG